MNVLSNSALYGKYPILSNRNGACGTAQELISHNASPDTVNQWTIFDRQTTVSISSSSIDDDGDPAGTGALTVKIDGIDRTGAAVTETVTMNGQTAVVTTATYMAVTAVTVVTVGAGTNNAGDLYVIRAGESALTAGVPDTMGAIMAKVAATAMTGTAGFLGLSSSSTADDTGGTGAITVQVYGTDIWFKPMEETVTLDGRTQVTTTSRFRRVHGVKVLTTGSGRTNAGDIYVFPQYGVTLSSGVPAAVTHVLCKVPVGMGQALSGIWTAPPNQDFKLNGFEVGLSGGAATVYAFARPLTGAIGTADTSEIKYNIAAVDSFTDGIQYVDTSRLAAMTGPFDLWFTGLSAGTSLVSVTASLERTR